jgi:phage-related protein
MEGLKAAFRNIFDFFASLLTRFYEAGAGLIQAFVDGIKAFISAPVDVVKEMGSRIRNFLPFSDAKVGPLSQLTSAGEKLTETFGKGILKRQPELVMDMQKLFQGIPVIGGKINKILPAPTKMISPTTSITNAPHTENKKVTIDKIELIINGVSNNAEEIGDNVILRLKREFEKYGI